MKKRVLSGLMICSLSLMTLAAPIVAAADTFDEQIQQQDQKISELQGQQATTQSKIDALATEIDTVNTKVQALETEQADLSEATNQLQEKIAELNLRIAKREKTIQNQARDVQVNGQSSNFIDAVLDSESLSDAIQRVEAMTKIVKANNSLVAQQKEDKQTVEMKVAENEKKIKVIEANQEELESQKSALANKQAELKVLKTTLAAEQATAENEKAKLNKQKQAAIEEAARIAKQQAEAKAARKAQEEKAAAALKKAQEKEQAQIAAEAAADSAVDSTVDSAQVSNESSTSDTAGDSATDEDDQSEAANNGSGQIDHSSQANLYAVGQCTWYVKHVAPWAGTYWGNGNQWGASAAADGYTVNAAPAAGTIVVFAAGQAVGGWNASSQYGHVAYVESYNAANNTITISQGGMGFSTPTGPNIQTISASGLQYIHR